MGGTYSYPAVPLVELTAVKIDDFIKAKQSLIIYAYHKFQENEKGDKLDILARELAKMLEKQAVVGKLNAGKYEDLAEELQITKVPAIVVITSEGKRTVLLEESQMNHEAVTSALFDGRPTSVFGLEEEKGLQAFLNLRISYPKVIFLYADNPTEARALSLIFRNRFLFAKIPYDIDHLSIGVFNATRIPLMIILTPSDRPALTQINSQSFAFDPKYNIHFYPAHKWGVYDVWEYLSWVLRVLDGKETPAPATLSKDS